MTFCLINYRKINFWQSFLKIHLCRQNLSILNNRNYVMKLSNVFISISRLKWHKVKKYLWINGLMTFIQHFFGIFYIILSYLVNNSHTNFSGLWWSCKVLFYILWVLNVFKDVTVLMVLCRWNSWKNTIRKTKIWKI